MTTPYALLGIISRQPNYGYDLKKDYDALFGRTKPLAFGQIYSTLARLLRDNKIESQSTEQSAGPERKKYTITPNGRAAVETWLKQPETLHSEVQSILFTKVVTSILFEKNPDEYLDAQRASHIAKMRELTAKRRNGDTIQMLQADYALFHLEADLRWIDMTTARIKALTKEIQHGR